MKKRLNVVVMVTLLFCFSIGSVSILSAQEIYNVSKPTYQVTADYGVMIPTRDGVRLASNIWKPKAEGKFPVLIQYSPYPKNREAAPRYFAERGYVVICAEKRGCGNSEGLTLDYFSAVEFQDGYDLVEWAAVQPWSNGKVGMFGNSYPAMMATRAAALQPPHLVALAYASEYANFFGDCFFPGGVRNSTLWGFRHLQNILRTMLKGPVYDDPVKGQNARKLDLDLYNYQITHDNWKTHTDGFWKNTEYNEFWMQKDLRSKYDKLKIPIMMFQCYFDDARMGDGGYQTFQYLTEKKVPIKLIVGPWAHAMSGGPQRVDQNLMSLAWFDYWLKGIDTGIQKEPPITIFVMRENKWRHENEWPIKRTQLTKYYLTPKGNLTTSRQQLITDVSKLGKNNLQYTYKPWVGVAGGPFAAGPTMQASLQYDEYRLQMDQRRDETDSLTFTSDTLLKDMEMTGMPEIEFYASSTSNDTNFCFKLCDVLPDGKSELVSRAWLNSSYRESNVNPRTPKDFKFVKPSKINPGEVVKYKITLSSTSYVFKKGHKIRLMIAGSDWPETWPNPNPAKNTIYFAQNKNKDFSTILLPIIPKQSPSLPDPKLPILKQAPPSAEGDLHCWVEEDLGPNPDMTTNLIKYRCSAISKGKEGAAGETWVKQDWDYVLPKGKPSDHTIPFSDTYTLTKDGQKVLERTYSVMVDQDGPKIGLKVTVDGKTTEY